MADNRFSLTRVRLKHYRSIASADVSLGDLLLLVGPNGSGKSNFLDALRLTSESLQTSLDQALRSRGGVAEVRRRSTGHPAHFTIDLEFRGEGLEGEYGFEVGAVKGGGSALSVSTAMSGLTLGQTKRSGPPTPGSAWWTVS
jgi:predicted ATPase